LKAFVFTGGAVCAYNIFYFVQLHALLMQATQFRSQRVARTYKYICINLNAAEWM